MKRSFIATALCAAFLSISPLSIATAIGHDETEQSGKAKRENTYWLGLVADQVSDDALRAHLGLGDDVGLLVNDVIPGTAAEKAGIQQYDVLVSASGSELKSPADLMKAANESGRSGKEISLELVRAGKSMNVKTKVSMRPTDSGNDHAAGLPRIRLEGAVLQLLSGNDHAAGLPLIRLGGDVLQLLSPDEPRAQVIKRTGSEPEAKSVDAEAAGELKLLFRQTPNPGVEMSKDDDGNTVIRITWLGDKKLNDVVLNEILEVRRLLPQIMKGQYAKSVDAEAAGELKVLFRQTPNPGVEMSKDDDGNPVIRITWPGDKKLNDVVLNEILEVRRLLPQIMKGQYAKSGSKGTSAAAPQNDGEENAETSTEKRLHALEAEVARLVEMLNK